MKKLLLGFIIFVVLLSSIAGCSHNREPATEAPDERESESRSAATEHERKETREYTELTIKYQIIDDEAVVIGYSGKGNHATIDRKFEGCNVTRIADSAFENCETLESVLFWADIESIGDSAFRNCSALTEISIPNETTEIGEHAFENCTALKELIIWGDPNIGAYSFANCTALEELSIGNDTKIIGEHAFEGCSGITSLIIWGAEEIGEYAFADCVGIEEISFPHGLQTIRSHAFDGCTALRSVIVWDKNTVIEEGAFDNCINLVNSPIEVRLSEKPDKAGEMNNETSAEVETEATSDSNANETETEEDTIAPETDETVSENTQETEPVVSEPTEPSSDEQNPYNDPGKWSLSTMTDYAHISESTIYLGSNEGVTISIEASTPGMNYDDFIVIYDEALLRCEPLFINENYNGKTIVKYKLWNTAPGRSEVLVVSGYELIDQGEDCSAYSLDVIGLDDKDGRIVYYTPTGEKYHFSSSCAGENAEGTTLWDAIQAGYEPCGKCAK